MPDIIHKLISSFHEFTDFVSGELKTSWIFRGQEEHGWSLSPSIDRVVVCGIHSRLIEQALLEEFKRRARPFLEQEPADDWEWLALAQHHGLATRLLDWTTNPLVALFFSVENNLYTGDSAVWCYKPPAATRSEDPFQQGRIVIYEPPHISQRITPQSGLFTAHPSSPYKSNDLWDDLRICLKIPGALRVEFRSILGQLGVHRASLFPGLDGLARFLCTTWEPPEQRIVKVWEVLGHDVYAWSPGKGRFGQVRAFNLNVETSFADSVELNWMIVTRSSSSYEWPPVVEPISDLEFLNFQEFCNRRKLLSPEPDQSFKQMGEIGEEK